MNKNHIKILAALFMLIDHAGLILFPKVIILRYIGRLSFPLFAFCIADGCVYTKNRRQYFLRVLVLGAACQAAFAIEELVISHRAFPGSALYFNILFTFALAILLCFAYLDTENRQDAKSVAKFCALLILIIIADRMCAYFSQREGAEISFDYGAAGAILPLFAVIKRKREPRMLLYTVGMLLFCLAGAAKTPYTWFALLSLPILYFYNGEPGKLKLKYGFYVFYPAHLAALYLIKLLTG